MGGLLNLELLKIYEKSIATIYAMCVSDHQRLLKIKEHRCRCGSHCQTIVQAIFEYWGKEYFVNIFIIKNCQRSWVEVCWFGRIL